MTAKRLQEFWYDEAGQDMVEYALLLAFVALGAIAVLGTVKTNLQAAWNTIAGQITNIKVQAGAGK